jgi:hypothetical protein
VPWGAAETLDGHINDEKPGEEFVRPAMHCPVDLTECQGH